MTPQVIRIGILIYLSPDEQHCQHIVSISGPDLAKKIRIQPDPDPQHWDGTQGTGDAALPEAWNRGEGGELLQVRDLCS
jgi:hypothetical protein